MKKLFLLSLLVLTVALSCAAFAEDIVRGEICADECVVFMREAFHNYLAAHRDSSRINKESEEKENE